MLDWMSMKISIVTSSEGGVDSIHGLPHVVLHVTRGRAPDRTVRLGLSYAKGGVLIALGEDASTELALVGGKGASLGRLVKAGFPVPAGFVIRTNAYAQYNRANDLEEHIERIPADLDFANLDELEHKTVQQLQ